MLAASTARSQPHDCKELQAGGLVQKGQAPLPCIPLLQSGAGGGIFTQESKQMQISDLNFSCLIGAEFIFHSEKCLSRMIYNPSGSVGVGN